MVVAVVTGCAGFIGSSLTRALIASGWEVRGIDIVRPYYDPAIKRANLSSLAPLRSFRFFERELADLEDPTFAKELLDGASVVYHQAAQPGVRASWSDFKGYVRDNIIATYALLEATVRSGIPRLVYASSSSVYGNAKSYPVVENSTLAPVSPYGVTKASAEQLTHAYSSNHPLSVVALRYFTVYGPGQRPDMATHRLIQAALTGDPFPLYGDGSQIRDFTFIADAVRANMLAGASDTPGFSAVNVSGGSEIFLGDLISLVERTSGRSIALDRRGTQAGDVRRTGGDNSLARELFGWDPRVPIEEGVAAQVEWERGLYG